MCVSSLARRQSSSRSARSRTGCSARDLAGRGNVGAGTAACSRCRRVELMVHNAARDVAIELQRVLAQVRVPAAEVTPFHSCFRCAKQLEGRGSPWEVFPWEVLKKTPTKVAGTTLPQ